jgi:plasmid stabilization system protein ParE
LQLRWTRRALGALDRIGSFIAAENPQAAGRVIGRILDSVHLLAEHPHAVGSDA